MDAPRSQSAAAPERSKRHTSGDSQGIGEGSGVTAQWLAVLVKPHGAKATAQKVRYQFNRTR